MNLWKRKKFVVLYIAFGAIWAIGLDVTIQAPRFVIFTNLLLHKWGVLCIRFDAAMC